MFRTKLITCLSALITIVTLSLSGCTVFPAKTSVYGDLYKRIPYESEGKYRVVNILYATSRKVEETRDMAISFLPKPAGDVTYATINVKIDPRIRIGKMLVIPEEKKRMMNIREIRTSDEDAFIRDVGSAVAASPHNSLLVLVFGYGNSFEDSVLKASYFAYMLDVNTPILLFDWPGDQATSLTGYNKARSLAESSGMFMGETLTKIIREAHPRDLWIGSGSLGCQVVCDAFEYMYQESDLSDADTEISHVFMSSPDVGQDEFDTRFKDELSALSRKLTAYVSSDDEALLISSFISGEKKLGLQRSRAEDQEQFEEMKDLLYLKSLVPDRISLVDVTPINRSTYKHGYYLEAPEFFDDLYMRIFEKDTHINRRLYLLKTENNVDYWVLK